MEKITLIVRLLLGLLFVVFGLNGFLHFIPTPEMTGDAGAFMGLLYGSGYLAVVKVLEIAGGALLLAGKSPLGLLLLTPVVVNINLFHIFFDPAGGMIAYVALVLVVYLLATVGKPALKSIMCCKGNGCAVKE